MAENSVVIEEASPAIEQAPITEATLKEANLSPVEIDMAKKNGMLPAEKTAEKKGAVKAEDKPVVSSIPVEELDSFEKVHDIYQNKPEEFYKLPKNIRNLYHNSKGLYKQFKTAEEKLKEIEVKGEFSKVQESVSRIKIDRIKQRLSNPEGLTVEELQELIGAEQAKVDENKPLTKKDLEDIEAEKVSKQAEVGRKAEEAQQKLNGRVLATESYAKENIKDVTAGKYDKVDDVVALAKELADTKPRYAKQINEVFLDDSMTEADILEVIVDIARLNPKWGTATSGKPEDGNVEKMVKNANKQQTSATLNGGKGSRVVTYDEMTPEDAGKLTESQWGRLPREVRDRILRQL